MTRYAIRTAEEQDIAALDAALRSLSRDLGDPHRAGTDALWRAIFGTPPSAWARVAVGDAGLAGVVLFAPVFSTVRGGAGLFVSDLWVAGDRRGMGLGRALLKSAAETAGTLWEAGFMRLSVHDDNARGRQFYRDLGFRAVGGQSAMVLTGQAFHALRRGR